MKNASLFQRSIQSLSHPIAITAAVLLWLNAAVFQPRYPTWWTGKLGDASWLILAPFLLLLLTSILFRNVPAQRVRGFGWAAMGFTAVALILMKVCAPLNAFINHWFSAGFGYSLKLTLDPTDLWVLPILALTAWIWDHPFTYSFWLKPVQMGAVLLAMVALVADAPAPFDHGITCLSQSGDTMIAIREISTRGYGGSKPNLTAYTSQDGGLSWRLNEALSGRSTPTPGAEPTGTISGSAEEIKASCPDRPDSWNLPDPDDPTRQYLFLSGQGVYTSSDNGETFKKEYALESGDQVYSALFRSDNRLVLALGPAGILIQSPDAGWKSISMSVFDPDRPSD